MIEPASVTEHSADILLADSVTDLSTDAIGLLVACGSHGGVLPGLHADYIGVAGIVFNDASVGRDGAGIAALSLLADRGRPAAAVSFADARVGSAEETLAAPIAHVNSIAAGLGCEPGIAAADALRLMARGTPPRKTGSVPPEARRWLERDGQVRVWVMDSASLALPSDAGSIIVTGSHGGLVGGRIDRALNAAAIAAVFNDAGGGIDGAGWSRLPALDARRVAAVTVSAATARIGDGTSTLVDGVISRVNATAADLGARDRMPTSTFIDLVANGGVRQ